MTIKKLSEVRGEELIDSTGITETLRINLIADGNSQCYRVTFDDESGVQQLHRTPDPSEASRVYSDKVKEYYSKSQ